jgi:hypothetical protein
MCTSPLLDYWMACYRWKRRHFVLTDDLLEYWDRMQGTHPSSIACFCGADCGDSYLCAVSSC